MNLKEYLQVSFVDKEKLFKEWLEKHFKDVDSKEMHVYVKCNPHCLRDHPQYIMAVNDHHAAYQFKGLELLDHI
uniref:Uncharacterized protein n=1 Tax=viral metagenome TaxID=1070528 RepID=A0A6C0CK22_9ZZZZ